MEKILIAYGSRYGSTKEIAEKIGEILEKQQLEPKLLNIREVKQKLWPKLSDFDGILIGSGIKIKMWTKEAKKFLKYIESSKIEKNIGLFVSCGDAMDPNKRELAKTKYLVNKIEQYKIKPAIYDAFGGVIDLSETSNLSNMLKKMMNAAADEDPLLNKGLRNDGRDWVQIENFAIEFAKSIKNQ